MANETDKAQAVNTAFTNGFLRENQIKKIIREYVGCQIGGQIWPGDDGGPSLGTTICTIERQILGLTPHHKYNYREEIYPSGSNKNIPQECADCPVFAQALEVLAQMAEDTNS